MYTKSRIVFFCFLHKKNCAKNLFFAQFEIFKSSMNFLIFLGIFGDIDTKGMKIYNFFRCYLSILPKDYSFALSKINSRERQKHAKIYFIGGTQ